MNLDYKVREDMIIKLNAVLMRVVRGEESLTDARTLREISQQIEGGLL